MTAISSAVPEPHRHSNIRLYLQLQHSESATKHKLSTFIEDVQRNKKDQKTALDIFFHQTLICHVK